jgi:hypothetical protein
MNSVFWKSPAGSGRIAGWGDRPDLIRQRMPDRTVDQLKADFATVKQRVQ